MKNAVSLIFAWGTWLSGGKRKQCGSSSLAEKLLVYIDLMCSNGLASVFVLVNLRSLLDDKTMELFTESCCQKEYKILLIDNKEYNKLSRENRLLIDADLCEF